MPKYGQVHFGRNYFGESERRVGNYKRSFANIPLGVRVRGQLAHQVIFRVRRGNGHAGAIDGVEYQDKYGYVVPGNINNAESTPYRTHWRASVDYWRNILTAEEKQAYNNKAIKGFRMSGYNLFMRAAMNGGISMYVDRGDPATLDFIVSDFTRDGTWRDLDLSAIIPQTARAILMEFDIETVNREKHIRIRKYGNTNAINHQDIETFNGGIHQSGSIIVAVDSNRIIEYNIDAATWTELDMTIRGWWT